VLDLLAPLGRPPLDTFSPTQVVRTAEVMPAGVWELEGGARFSPVTGLTGAGGLRGGLLPGLELSVAFPPPANWDAERRLVGLRFAPIPSLWSLEVSSDVPPFGGRALGLEAGSTLEIALPWFTPRLSPRVFYLRSPGPDGFAESLHPRLAVGVETRAFKVVSLGLDYDYGFWGASTLNFGTRFRAIGNLGGALFASLPTYALGNPSTYKAGFLAAMRF